MNTSPQRPTIIVQSLLVSEDVSPHVPDDLVSHELRLPGHPQNELTDITHGVIADSLYQLGHVEQQAFLQIQGVIADSLN